MVRSLESTHAWFERVVWEVEQKAARSGKGATKDYAAAFADPELGARVALVKVQAGKVHPEVFCPSRISHLPRLSSCSRAKLSRSLAEQGRRGRDQAQSLSKLAGTCAYGSLAAGARRSSMILECGLRS